MSRPFSFSRSRIICLLVHSNIFQTSAGHDHFLLAVRPVAFRLEDQGKGLLADAGAHPAYTAIDHFWVA
jgi:hypothetical protein